MCAINDDLKLLADPYNCLPRRSSAMDNFRINDIHEGITLVIGGVRYELSPALAQFLSPKVCFLQSVDLSITEYVPEATCTPLQFQDFLLVDIFECPRVNKSNRDCFLSLTRELGNSEHYAALLHCYEPDWALGQIFDAYCDDAIPFLASQFSQLNTSQLDSMSASTLYHILSHDSLRISSEDALYWYISSRFSADPECWDLFLFVQFEYLSLQCISHFLSIVPDYIDGRFWEVISSRLIPGIHQRAIRPLPDAQLGDGIISSLMHKHRDVLHENQIVTVTSKSGFAPDRLLNENPSSNFWSDNEPGQWICCDFHEMRVRPTHYTITSLCMTSWVIESSLDGVNWIEIDRQTDNEYLRRAYNDRDVHYDSAAFPVWISVDCRYIRLTQTSKNSSGTDELVVGFFDVFGSLVEQQE
jgi:hypothetical protein